MPADAPGTDGLLHAWKLDGRGGGTRLGWADVEALTPGLELVWIHLDFTHPRARQWLAQRSGVDELVVESLLAEDSRPRSVEWNDGLLTVLRGVNLNPGADADDMVSMRIWLEPKRIISTRRRRLQSVVEMREAIGKGQGPVSPSDFLLRLIDGLNMRIETVVENLDEQIEVAETRYGEQAGKNYRGEFSSLRRQTACIRRHLTPQRDGLDKLSRHKMALLDDGERLELREQADRLTRYLESLDLVRERAMVAQEELLAMIAQQQNQRMYLLSIVAVVFLPLSYVTGLMGMNVAGLPGTENPLAFAILLALMSVAAAVILILLKLKKWI